MRWTGKSWCDFIFSGSLHKNSPFSKLFLAFPSALMPDVGRTQEVSMASEDSFARKTAELERKITERKLAEEELRKSKEQFQVLVESSSDWIWEVDRNGVYTYVSPKVKDILGYKPEEVVGKTPFDLMPPEEAKRIAATFKRLIGRREPIVAMENVNLHKDGRRVVLETSGVPVLDAAGNVHGYRGVDRDITLRKKTEEALQRVQRIESIGMLAGGIAHDFNNILMGLFGNISIAKIKLSKDHPAFKSLERAEQSMDSAIYLTSQLRTFAKGGEPVKEDVSLGELVEEVSRFNLSGSNVMPVFEQAEDLWMSEVDKGQVQQVFSNLTINANQAMPDGGHLYITLENANIPENAVSGLNQGRYIKVTVRDEGIGIDQKNLNRIFDPYFSTKQIGSGLGLATVYSIVNKHGGHISADSELSKGTTFTLYLPASESRRLPETKQPATERSTIEQPARLLVMDDEEIVRDVVTEMLKESGFSVETAPDGKQAIEMYKQSLDAGEPFDVVIMDLTIPGGIGGKEAIKDILEIDPEARAIVSSGYADDPVMANYAECGFKGIAAKPYTMSELLEVLSQVLKK
ncbi:MAG: PAS domain S-box protein [Deltaproteobacteria bacterium]|nr:PAS domain S-box protein [Deltaproteobacteria bacterium]